MDRDYINLLYLELSQFSTATTSRELILKTALENIVSSTGTKSMRQLRLTAEKALSKYGNLIPE